ncbi:MAG: hypothetical protein K1000chlam3_00005 [Chlamydiae bacterium]|nr:hypothetical protein [Chlamydiota bacterium]
MEPVEVRLIKILPLRYDGAMPLTLEEKKERLDQQKARLLRKGQKLKTEERKKKIQKLINLGKLINDADLSSLDEVVLKGALSEIKEKSSGKDALENWQKKGQNQIEKAAKQSALIISFPSPPSKELESKLKNLGLKWNPFREEWQGFGELERINVLLKDTNAVIEQIR